MSSTVEGDRRDAATLCITCASGVAQGQGRGRWGPPAPLTLCTPRTGACPGQASPCLKGTSPAGQHVDRASWPLG